jgi:hypothetical protein
LVWWIFADAAVFERALTRVEAPALTQWHQFGLVRDAARDAIYVVATVQSYDLHGVESRIPRLGVLPGS